MKYAWFSLVVAILLVVAAPVAFAGEGCGAHAVKAAAEKAKSGCSEAKKASCEGHKAGAEPCCPEAAKAAVDGKPCCGDKKLAEGHPGCGGASKVTAVSASGCGGGCSGATKTAGAATGCSGAKTAAAGHDCSAAKAAGGCSGSKAAGEKAGDCWMSKQLASCPGSTQTEVTKVALPGRLLCERCNLKTSKTCSPVFKADNRDDLVPLCPNGNIDGVKAASDHGKNQLKVKGVLCVHEDGVERIMVTSWINVPSQT